MVTAIIFFSSIFCCISTNSNWFFSLFLSCNGPQCSSVQYAKNTKLAHTDQSRSRRVEGVRKRKVCTKFENNPTLFLRRIVEYRGNFWAGWCGSSIVPMPVFSRLPALQRFQPLQPGPPLLPNNKKPAKVEFK